MCSRWGCWVQHLFGEIVIVLGENMYKTLNWMPKIRTLTMILKEDNDVMSQGKELDDLLL